MHSRERLKNVVVRQSVLALGGLPGATGATGPTGATGATGPVTLTGNQTFTGGFKFTPYNLGDPIANNFAVDPFLGNYQFGVNNAACGISPPASDCAVDLLITNGVTAGTFSFYNTGSSWVFAVGNTGDPMTTVAGHKFIISVRRIAGYSTYIVKALQ
jgi:hypothetical protein